MSRLTITRFHLLFAFLCGFGLLSQPATAQSKTKNVIFVMTDGLRWQDVFQGADAALMNKEHGGVANPEELKKRYWNDNAAARRELLMPFLWKTVAKQGQIYGNRALGSDAWVTNGKNFSYPGYSEAFCGFADDRVDSNNKVFNQNVTMFEWLHQKPAFRGKVAAFGAWELFPWILNQPRAGFTVNAGYEPFTELSGAPRIALINRLKAETAMWEGEAFDSFPFHTAIEYMRAKKPRLLYLSLGETDEWSHGGKYGDYLNAAARVDAYIRELWETAQSMPEYRGKTTLVVATDHGRGEAPVEWKSHGQKIPDSKYVWLAVMGPDTRALGERTKTEPVTQSQIAATIAALLGEDYAAAVAKAGKPVRDVLSK